MRKILVLLLLAVPCLLNAQTAVSANHVEDAFLRPIASAKLCFAPTDAASNPVGFRTGSVQVLPGQVCGLVSNGVLQSGWSVASSPSGIYYHIWAANRATGAVIKDYGLTQITGSSWTLDTYDPATMAALPVGTTIGTVTTLPAGSQATASLSGSGPYQMVLGIPQGTQGPVGPQGPPGTGGGAGGVFYASAYGVQANAKWVTNASVTSGQGTVTCPSSNCNFAAGDVGKIVFGTNSSTSGSVVLPQGTISAVNSAQSITVSSTATATQSANLVLVWGSDDSNALASAWAASAGACSTLMLPAGNILVQSAQFNTMPNTKCATSNSPYAAAGIRGVDITATWIIPTPGFNFSSCTGGISGHACFGGTPSARYTDFSIWGAGNALTGQNLGGVNFLEIAQSTGVNLMNITSWGMGSTNSTCVLDASTQSGFYQGGVQECGYNGMVVTSGGQCASEIASYFGPAGNKGLVLQSGACLSSFNGTFQAVEVQSGGKLYSYNDNYLGPSLLVDAGGAAYFAGALGPGYTGRTCTGICGTDIMSQTLVPVSYTLGTVAYSDNFTRANGALGGNWVNSPTGAWTTCAPQIISNAASAGTGSSYCSSYYSSALTADQFSQGTIGNLTSTGSTVGVTIRQSTSADTRYQLGVYHPSGASNVYFEKLVNGVSTEFPGSPFSVTLATGNMLRLSVTGSLLTASYSTNGGSSWTVIATANDSTIATGQPGFFGIQGSNAETLTSWAAGSAATISDLVGTGSPTGACATGSTYHNSTGTTGNTLWSCVNGAWVDID